MNENNQQNFTNSQKSSKDNQVIQPGVKQVEQTAKLIEKDTKPYQTPTTKPSIDIHAYKSTPEYNDSRIKYKKARRNIFFDSVALYHLEHLQNNPLTNWKNNSRAVREAVIFASVLAHHGVEPSPVTAKQFLEWRETQKYKK